MNRPIAIMLLCVFLAGVAACGGGDTAEETTETTTSKRRPQDERPDYWPQASPYSRLSEAVLDTLRGQKKLHGITRDEYWGGAKGGVLANEYMEVWYPEGRTAVTHGMFVFNHVRPARNRFIQLFGSAPRQRLVVRLSRDMDQYKRITPRDWWHYSHIDSDTLTYQPVYVLFKRGLDTVAIPREYYQWALAQLTEGRSPRWLEEGIASWLSREEAVLKSQLPEFSDYAEPMSVERIESILAEEQDRRDTRIAYYRAYRMVQKLVEAHGEDKLVSLVKQLHDGKSVDGACRAVYGQGYDETLGVATAYTM